MRGAEDALLVQSITSVIRLAATNEVRRDQEQHVSPSIRPYQTNGEDQRPRARYRSRPKGWIIDGCQIVTERSVRGGENGC